ncbi:U-box domain-containing protein 52 [Platanthera guangdongensis]|uniref:RING-type E3 ubiquitin transferase n=1 Tax=Platanthera guangdongensis TaxID=2320717 RepID=A0ABR2MNT7_9ASPA
MRRNESQLRHAGGNEEAAGIPQVVVVAIDSDKNSQHAIKWAADHILKKGEIFILLHVRRKVTAIPSPSGLQIPINDVEDEVSSAYLEQIDLQTKELLLPFQCFCSRRGLQCKEVIMNESDVPKAIVDFVMYQGVDKLVLGSSNRNAFMRTFKQMDVPTAVSKTAPEFCSVFVITKGKMASCRPATDSKKLFHSKLQELDSGENTFQSVKSTPELGPHFGSSGRTGAFHDTRNVIHKRVYDNNSGEMVATGAQLGGQLDFSSHSTYSCPSPSRINFDSPKNIISREIIDAEGRHLHLSSFLNEHNGREQGKGFESCTYDHGSYSNPHARLSFEHGGGNWQGGSGPIGFGHMPPMPKREPGTRLNHSSDNMESHMGKLRLEMKQMNLHEESSTQEEYPANKSFEAMKAACFTEEMAVAPKAAFDNRRSIPPLPESPEALKNEASSQNSADSTWLQEIAEKRKELETISIDIRYRRYSTEDILKATNNFSDSLKVGEGGYGPVFKSTLDHTLVAIKILRSDVAQGIKQFHKEVEVLSCIRHPNMVLLIGACPEYGCLVYEYMSNGSLEDRLFCSSGTPPLSWQQRFKIAAEVATGLLFLHQTKPEPLVHRDLKPGNILLDSNFISKIADVGLARLIPPSRADATQYHMTVAAGTFCYIDPEYQKTGMVSTKSDIYALGIILLQLITGRPPMGLTHNVEKALEMGNLEQLLDPNVPNWPIEHAKKLALMGLECAELRRKDRPDLATVILPQLKEMRAFAESTFEASWQNSSWNSMGLRGTGSSLPEAGEFACRPFSH